MEIHRATGRVTSDTHIASCLLVVPCAVPALSAPINPTSPPTGVATRGATRAIAEISAGRRWAKSSRCYPARTVTSIRLFIFADFYDIDMAALTATNVRVQTAPVARPARAGLRCAPVAPALKAPLALRSRSTAIKAVAQEVR
eukprot:scaffold153639_cov50-Prasinocladus_malaysianus.AAC.3